MIKAVLEQFDETIEKKLDKMIIKQDDIIENIASLQKGINSDLTRPLNMLQIERTLVERYSEESLIWAMTQIEIGNSLNQLYQLNSVYVSKCKRIEDIYNSDEALKVCASRSEIIDLLYLYPYLDFKSRIQSLMPLPYCISRNQVMNVYQIGDIAKINIINYGDVNFQLISKHYDSEDTSCWLTLDTLFDFTQTDYKWSDFHSYSAAGLIAKIKEISTLISDSVIKNSLQVATRNYAYLRINDETLNNKITYSEKSWIANGTQIGCDSQYVNLENPIFDFYKNIGNSKKKNKAYYYGRTALSKVTASNYYYFSKVDIYGEVQQIRCIDGNEQKEITLSIPIGITIKG